MATGLGVFCANSKLAAPAINRVVNNILLIAFIQNKVGIFLGDG